ncbi:hypothetical protein [Micromonospora sp. RTP1Z1]|nr:hypothetical protein [Micromonospora sp. RTP1Z1]
MLKTQPEGLRVSGVAATGRVGDDNERTEPGIDQVEPDWRK